MLPKVLLSLAAFVLVVESPTFAGPPSALRTGVAEHAFDHNGQITDQLEAAVASGENIIYCGHVGDSGYNGLPEKSKMDAERKAMADYIKRSKKAGVRLAIGYVCATSIVKLETFDRNWPRNFRSQFHTRPADWLQQDKNGKPLPSWYGGDYRPACMNNPDWRAYEKNVMSMELESGCDGIFFDNPTVHPDGCYCEFCMKKFAEFLGSDSGISLAPNLSLAELRKQASAHPREFMKFRSTIASDFLDEMENYAHSIRRGVLITCNNSLNTPDVLFSQIRADGYNINEMSRVEDYVLVEDMNTQPRMAGGRTFEYGPTYKELHAINHDKPIVAVTVADADYHTPPNLMRLAMAEAAAHDASYLAWPTWPEAERKRMAATVRPEADFLLQNQKLLNNTTPRSDVTLFLCFRRWLDTPHCTVSDIAAALGRENIQFAVYSEENFDDLTADHDGRLPVLVLESRSVLNDEEKRAVQEFERKGGRVVAADHQGWMEELKKAVPQPSVIVQGPASVRVAVRDQGSHTIAHIYNLNVEKTSLYADKVNPADNVLVKVRKASGKIHSVHVLSADAGGAEFTSQIEENGTVAVINLPHLQIETIALIE